MAISNILPTIFNIRIKIFFFGSMIGMAPQLFVGTSLGSGIEKIIHTNNTLPSLTTLLTSKDIYIPIIAFVLIILLSYFLRKKFYKN